jgi:REP element-mobilizing transposase RayT
MDDKIHPPGYAALRRFRESKSSADYFLTMNLAQRGRGLEAPALTAQAIEQWQKLEADELWSVRTTVVMPDHLHLLVALGAVHGLAECIRQLKGRLSPGLRAGGLRWQPGFYEHRLREAEDVLPVFLYIYLNPYRAGLLSIEQTWPGYRCRAEDWQWFGPMTRASTPQPEWLR